MNPLIHSSQNSDSVESRSTILALLAAFSYSLGLFLRYKFIFVWNRPTAQANLFSDMLHYWLKSAILFDPASRGTIDETQYPPGTSYYIGFLRLLDPSLELLVWMQFLLSAILPLVVACIGYRVWGKRCGFLALMVISLYFPAWEYFGYLCSEGPFSVFLLLSFYLLIRSLQSRGVPSLSWGFLMGLSIGLSASFKSVSLATWILVFSCLLVLRFFRGLKVSSTIFAGLLGLLFILVPMSIRATKLNEGRFLLIANDSGRGFLLGHLGRVRKARFVDEKRGYHHEFMSPTALQRGYRIEKNFTFGLYDTAEHYEVAREWIRENPLEALLQSIEHVFDLFAFTLPWPGFSKPYYSWVVFFQEMFMVLILFPAAYFVVRNFQELRKCQLQYLGEYLILAAVASICLTSFLFIGEPRYRVPYDGFLILLACRTMSRCEARNFISSSKIVSSSTMATQRNSEST